MAFQDRSAEFQEKGAVVVGVSPDTISSHQKFREKHGLNLPLLSDPDHKVAESYGVYKEKTMYGKKRMGIERSTFIMDENGVVSRAFRRVKVEGHADEVLAALQKEAKKRDPR